ncbi:MAG: hypothetical protein OIN87_02500 [Candidatus Methanoperedens sp.]|nr:hypothetical protein [Candidatus Methanoperedens sp.]
MINKNYSNLIVLVLAVSLLIISGCVNPTPQGTAQPTPTATAQTQTPITLNNYLEEAKNKIHTFGPSNSSSSASIYISSGQKIDLAVPLMLDGDGNPLKMFENPTITGDLKTMIVNTEYGKALKINGTGGEIKMTQDEGNPGSLDNESLFLGDFTISMSNNTVVDLNNPFTYQVITYSGNDVKDLRLFYSRSGGQSGKIVYVRTGNFSQPSEISISLGKGWPYINLYGDNVVVK